VSRSRFVAPETVRLPLSDGDWIEVKTRLNYGEQAHLNKKMYGRVDQAALAGNGAGLGVDIEAMAIEFLVTFLTDWSFRDADDKPVALNRDAVAALDPETADEVQSAIARHAQETDRGKVPRNGATKHAAPSG
jgi:hypothetical protein